jgi:cytochrome c oxidase subunit 2
VGIPGVGNLKRFARFLLLSTLALGLGGCTLPTFGAFRGATAQGQAEFKLWSWMTIAGLIVAVIVWGLILWAVIAYRRRDPDKMPRQFHSNMPVEIIYTAVPLLIVAVIFFYTVTTENKIDALAPHPAVKIKVTGFQWGWSFSYVNSAGKQIALVETAQARPPVLAGNPTSPEYPQFVLPVGETTQIMLVSADVVHGFYVPAFNFGRYALPGVTNYFDFTPVHTGVFPGHCSQYCGLYHAEMLFSVRVVKPAAFQTWLNARSSSGAAA